MPSTISGLYDAWTIGQPCPNTSAIRRLVIGMPRRFDASTSLHRSDNQYTTSVTSTAHTTSWSGSFGSAAAITEAPMMVPKMPAGACRCDHHRWTGPC